MRPIASVLLGLAAACACPAWAMDINGKTIGMPIDQVAKDYGKRWTCEVATDARAGDLVCRKSMAVDEFPRMQNENFAGSHVTIFYRFHDDRLVRIRVSGVRNSRFESFLDTLKSAYGEPVVESGSVQGKSGKAFDRTTARWESDGVVLDLVTSMPKPPALSLSLYDAEYWKQNASAASPADGD